MIRNCKLAALFLVINQTTNRMISNRNEWPPGDIICILRYCHRMIFKLIFYNLQSEWIFSCCADLLGYGNFLLSGDGLWNLGEIWFEWFWYYTTNAMSLLSGNFAFFPSHNALWIVKASIVTVRLFVWILVNFFPPELYLEYDKQKLIWYF